MANSAKMVLTIDKFGRVLIPKALRQHLSVVPGDKIQVSINDEKKSIELAAENQAKKTRIVHTDWGFPIVESAGDFPEDYDFSRETKDMYDEYFKRILGF